MAVRKTIQAPESFDSFRHLVNENYDDLSPQLRRIARFALDDPNMFALETVVRIAHRVDAQPSSLVRFAKTFGFRGFSDLQKIFRTRLIEGAPAFRDDIYAHHLELEQSAEDNPLEIFNEFSRASIYALQKFQEGIDGADLSAALDMMMAAENIYVIGQRRAFPVAAYVYYGLTRLEMRGHLLDFVGGMVPQQVATLTPDDLLIAISYAEYAPPVVEAVKDAYIRGIPTLTITDTSASPLYKYATRSFTVYDAEVHRFRPLAATMALVQSLIVALGYRRDAEQGG